jgi:arylsulfatase A-like enzyme
MVDRWVGRPFDTVDKLGLFEESLVIWTTDHGHLFGEHNLEGKPGGQPGNLYETTTRIPLMVYHLEGAGEGSSVGGLVQPQDIMPTVQEAIGAPIPTQTEGHSLWPMIDSGAASRRRYSFSGRFPPMVGGATRQPAVGHLFDGWVGSDRIVESITVTSNETTMLVGPQGRRSELYDLADDPAQRRNITGLRAEEESETRGAAIEFLREHGASPERIAPFTDGIPVAEIDQGMTLWAFRDDRERWVAFPTEQQAIELALDREGNEARAVTETTLGALLEDDPHSLIHTHGQYYWASDLT